MKKKKRNVFLAIVLAFVIIFIAFIPHRMAQEKRVDEYFPPFVRAAAILCGNLKEITESETADIAAELALADDNFKDVIFTAENLKNAFTKDVKDFDLFILTFTHAHNKFSAINEAVKAGSELYPEEITFLYKFKLSLLELLDSLQNEDGSFSGTAYSRRYFAKEIADFRSSALAE